MQDKKGHSHGYELPMGSLTYTPPKTMQKFLTSLKLFLAPPWRKFKKGSVLVIEVQKYSSTVFACSEYMKMMPRSSITEAIAHMLSVPDHS